MRKNIHYAIRIMLFSLLAYGSSSCLNGGSFATADEDSGDGLLLMTASPIATNTPSITPSPTSTQVPTQTPYPTDTRTPTITPTPYGGSGGLLFYNQRDLFLATGDGSSVNMISTEAELLESYPLLREARWITLAPDGNKAFTIIRFTRPLLLVFSLEAPFLIEVDMGDYDFINDYQWSPAGDMLLFGGVVIGKGTTYFILDLHPENAGRVDKLGNFGSKSILFWSPEGEGLYLLENNRLSILHMDASKQSIACDFCDDFNGYFPESAIMSPDGSRIAILYNQEQKIGAEKTILLISASDFSEHSVIPLEYYSFSPAFDWIWSGDNRDGSQTS